MIFNCYYKHPFRIIIFLLKLFPLRSDNIFYHIHLLLAVCHYEILLLLVRDNLLSFWILHGWCKDTCPKCTLNLNLRKCHLPCLNSAVQSFWNFAQTTAIAMPSSVCYKHKRFCKSGVWDDSCRDILPWRHQAWTNVDWSSVTSVVFIWRIFHKKCLKFI